MLVYDLFHFLDRGVSHLIYLVKTSFIRVDKPQQIIARRTKSIHSTLSNYKSSKIIFHIKDLGIDRNILVSAVSFQFWRDLSETSLKTCFV